LESKDENWEDWLVRQIKEESQKTISIDKKKVFVEGESAGGHAAVTAMWLNAEKNGPHIPIEVALLRYLMVAHYERTFVGPAMGYMDALRPKAQVEELAGDVKAIILELERLKVVPTVTARHAPTDRHELCFCAMRYRYLDLAIPAPARVEPDYRYTQTR
jgi:hypothetical protein